MLSGKRKRKKPKYLRDDESSADSAEENGSASSATTSTSAAGVASSSAASNTSSKQKKVVKSAKGTSSNATSGGKKDKSKKHKKVKKGKKEAEVEPEDITRSEENPRPGIKLKFKFGGKTVGTSVTATPVQAPSEPEPYQDSSLAGYESDDVVDIEGDMEDDASSSQLIVPKDKDGGDSTSEEEREWLEAVEAGDLEDYEKKKAEKNPLILTARQRALLHGENDEQLVELPSQYKNTEMSEEQLQRRKQRAVKRRQQAIEKREKAKKLTVDRLLKKQDSAQKGRWPKSASSSKQVAPHCRYVTNAKSSSISLPVGLDFPLVAQKASEPKLKGKCAVDGCSNPKKYNCSKTNIPLCSLQCYKVNLNKQNLVAVA